MVWFRVDDGFPKSRKVLSIPKRRRAAAVGVWLLAGAWCAGELTDGFIPRYALDEIPNGSQAAPDLVSANLWEPAEGGWRFRNWSEYQPKKDEVEREREDSAARQKAYRDRKRAERNALLPHNALRNASNGETVSRPVPTRPVVPTELQEQTPPSEVLPRRKRAARLPDDWEPNSEQIAWVRSHCPGIDGRIETVKFRNHFHSKPGPNATKLDWNLTYQNWMLGARPGAGVQFGRPTQTRSTTDDRVSAALALAAELRDENQTTYRQIGTGS